MFNDLEDEFSREPGRTPREFRTLNQNLDKAQAEALAAVGNTGSQRAAATYEETCKDCRGTGKFYGYSGRLVGDCFKCKGKGKSFFKTSPEHRAKLRDRSADRKAAQADVKGAEVRAWLEANPERAAFLQQTWDFPVSLRTALHQWGRLTENQVAAIDRSLEKQKAREAEKAAVRAAAPVSGLDLSKVPTGFYAVPGGDTRLKLKVRHGEGKWNGWVFVDDGAGYGQGEKYGTQRPGEQYQGKVLEQLRTIAADPLAASKAYGHLVGACGRCGRKLEDAASVAAGIGPICAQKFDA